MGFLSRFSGKVLEEAKRKIEEGKEEKEAESKSKLKSIETALSIDITRIKMKEAGEKVTEDRKFKVVGEKGYMKSLKIGVIKFP